jgi:hypothetical protein|tara:strand:- start:1300 stop:1587 length:288 start_codon:yes stop_codon:yes gene_type:complete
LQLQGIKPEKLITRRGVNKMAWRLWGTQQIGDFLLGFGPKHLSLKKQGYDARKDEQLAMIRGKSDFSFKARRDIARATRKPKGSYGFTHKRGKKK